MPLQSGQEKEFIFAVYVKGLDREPDEGGLEHWANLAAKGPKGVSAAVQGIIRSVERRQKDIEALYQKVLGRESDEEGLVYWLKSRYTIQQIEEFMYQSDEFLASLSTVDDDEIPQAPNPKRK